MKEYPTDEELMLFIEKLEQAIDEKGNFLTNWVF